MDSEQAPQTAAIAAIPSTPLSPSDDGTNPFIGRFGLRAGWGIAIYILLFAVCIFGLNVGMRVAEGKSPFPSRAQIASAQAEAASKPAKDVTAGQGAIQDGSVIVVLGLVSWILSRIERRRIGVYGIGSNRIRDFLPGAFWGLATLSLLVAVLRATHVLVFDSRALTGFPIAFFAIKWLLTFLMVGIAEEYLNRGYLQYTLTRGLFGLGNRISPAHARAIAFWTAAVIMSFLFGAGHLGNPGETAPGITAVFLAGMVFSYTLWYTGSLWWGIGFHMAWDWAQSFLYGVPDSGLLSAGRLFNTHPTGNPLLSGGTTGPEGSIFVIPAFLIVILAVRLSRPGTQPTFEPLPPKPQSVSQEPNPVIA